MKLGKLILYLEYDKPVLYTAAFERLKVLAQKGEVAYLTPLAAAPGLPKKWTAYTGWNNLIEPLKKASKCHFKGLLLANWQTHVRTSKKLPLALFLDEILVFCRCCRYQASNTLVVLDPLDPKDGRDLKLRVAYAKARDLLISMADEIQPGEKSGKRKSESLKLNEKEAAHKGFLRRPASFT